MRNIKITGIKNSFFQTFRLIYLITNGFECLKDFVYNRNSFWFSTQKSSNIFKDKCFGSIMVYNFYETLKEIVPIIIGHRVFVLGSTVN